MRFAYSETEMAGGGSMIGSVVKEHLSYNF